MLGIDTNVLIRFLVRDDERQFEKARKLIRREVRGGNPVFVSQLVLLEAEWVLRSRYDSQKEDIIKVVSALLDAADVQLEDESDIEQALYVWKESNAGFADCIIGARNSKLGCSATATFDAKASRLPGFVSV